MKKDLFIEQWRGIAVLLVIIYHYTTRIPYNFMGSASKPLVEFYSGKIGVYIFFIISGYLIAKTLENSITLGEFYAKRVSRIWPLFLIANIFVFFWAHVFPTPVVPPGLNDFDVHGRTIYDLIGTSFFLKDLGFEWIDGAYWTILTELKYYVLIGIFAYLFKSKFLEVFVWRAILLGILEFSTYIFYGEGSYTLLNKFLHGVLIAHYLPAFAVGMMLYHKKYNFLLAICAFLCTLLILIPNSHNINFDIMPTLKFLILFTIFLVFDQVFAKGYVCAFFERYSYSIYLFHQVVGLSLIFMMSPVIGINFAILVAFILVLILSVFASWLIEWRFRKQITLLLIKLGALISLDKLYLDISSENKKTTTEI